MPPLSSGFHSAEILLATEKRCSLKTYSISFNKG